MIYVVTGPSGCGKSSLLARVLALVPATAFSVSHTTRPRRPSEEDGREYRFVDEPAFQKLVRRGAFLEWARVHGHLYGTAKREVAAKARAGDVLLDIDVQGALQIRAQGPKAVFVFVLPPSYRALEQRLRGRGDEPPEAVAVRLRNARREVRFYRRFDYCVVNDDLERAVGELAAILLAGRARTAARAREAAAIVRTFAGAAPPGRRTRTAAGQGKRR